MKKTINPAVFIGAIVAVIAIACFFGIRALLPDTSRAANPQTKMTSDQEARYQNGRGGMNMSSSSGGRSSAQYEQYQRMQQNQGGGR
jgi:hypothetical protein